MRFVLNKNKIYTCDDPHICNIFLNHCKEGLSPRSFIGKLIGGEKAYNILRDHNPKFREIIKTYQKSREWGGRTFTSLGADRANNVENGMDTMETGSNEAGS